MSSGEHPKLIDCLENEKRLIRETESKFRQELGE